MANVVNKNPNGSVPPDGGVNWDAYSHDELYQMLWQEADVADVSTIATEWAQHRTALTTHAEVLREQRVALLDSWQGTGAEDAAARLEKLAARVEKIAELAYAGEVAAQEGADALAMARAAMPPPPSNPTAPLTNPAPGGFGTAGPTPGFAGPPVPDASSMSSMDSYMDSMDSYVDSMNSSLDASMESMESSRDAFSSSVSTPNFTDTFTPTTSNPFLPPSPAPAPATTTPSAAGSDPAAGLGAVGGSGFSFYVGSAAADQRKAQAVHTMQTYESSLTRSSQLIGEARGAVPAAAQSSSAVTPEQQRAPGAGVPWQRLLGTTGRAGSGVGGGSGGPGAVKGAPVGPGARVGVSPGMTGAPGMAAARLAAESAARAGGFGGMMPPAGARGSGAGDEKHENQMPTVDHQLFAVDEPHSRAVIGLMEGEQ